MNDLKEHIDYSDTIDTHAKMQLEIAGARVTEQTALRIIEQGGVGPLSILIPWNPEGPVRPEGPENPPPPPPPPPVYPLVCHCPDRIHLRDNAGPVVTTFTSFTNAAMENITFFLYDHLGNTRVTYYLRNCESTVTVENILDYDPYGKVLRDFTNPSSDKERYVTTQHERDKETGYDYRGARFYDSDIARFLSVDPIAKTYHSHSPYNYVSGNPIMLIDPDGRDWIYYNESGAEIGRTKSKWYHGHWMTGDKQITLTNDEINKGGFAAYVTFKGTITPHAAIVDVSTGNLYEVRHPIVNGENVNGREFKQDWQRAASQVVKFEHDPEYEFANKDWWTYTIKNKDGSYSDKSPSSVGVTYIWIPNRTEMVQQLEHMVGQKLHWDFNFNCKTFTRNTLMNGYQGVTDKRHLEIKSNLEDEDVYPGSWFNEFEENKTIENPHKK